MLTKRHKTLNVIMAVVCIGIPVTLTSSYVMFFAQDRYVSDSVIAVKRIGETTIAPTTGLSALIGANNTSVEDVYYLKEYIHSADMLNKLNQDLNLTEAFKGNRQDPIFQLDAHSTKEELLAFYRDRVILRFDEKTNLLAISTEGFSPDFALKLNQAVLLESDRFINDLSHRVARDQVVQSERQLEQAALKLSAAKEAVLNYQNQNKTFDPLANAQMVNQLIAGLKANLADLQTQERTLLSYLNADTPQVVSIRSQIRAVEQQIAQEQTKLTSTNEVKLNRQAMQFEVLKSNVDFSLDLYKLALTALEKSRVEAVQKMKNVMVISSPQLAQEALYPRRLYLIFSTLMISCLLYGVIRLLLTVIREHQD